MNVKPELEALIEAVNGLADDIFAGDELAPECKGETDFCTLAATGDGSPLTSSSCCCC